MTKKEKNYRQYDRKIKFFERKIYSNVMPSKKWYYVCQNRNAEMYIDEDFKDMYYWLKDAEKMFAEEYRGMVNSYRKHISMR